MTRSERIVSAVILAGLLCIAAGVSAYRLRAQPSSPGLWNLLAGAAPTDWHRRGPVEEYPADRLNEKINGGDIEFLSRGCLGLAWSSYVNKAQEDLLISVSIYDMGHRENAKKIYESVRGPWGADLQASQIGDEGYSIAGSLFFRDGRYYLQLQAGADSPAIDLACKFLGREISNRIRTQNR